MANDLGGRTTHAVCTEHIQASQKIWDYMKLNHVVKKCDVIIALGSNDLRVAHVASDLWLQGCGDWLVLSGKVGHLSAGKWPKTEAEMFYDIALSKGVPADKLIIENEATNSGENARFTHKILQERNITPRSLLLVQKPFMERRAYATFMKQWPTAVDITVTSMDISMTDYPTDDTGPLPQVISVFVGDLQRIPLYEEKGFQIYQDVPSEVWDAYNLLRSSGLYNHNLVA